MKHSPILSAILFFALLAAADTAYAQQPPDVVQSDAFENTAMGINALKIVTTGNIDVGGFANTAAGAYSLASNGLGSFNTAFGAEALLLNTTASGNSAFGSQSLQTNTTGTGNSAFGFKALGYSTTGDFNTAAGSEALESNTTGHDNTASGSEAMIFNTIGNSNTASGSGALRYNTSGGDNTATGAESINSNTTGYQNTASGALTLYSNTVGNHNTATGSYALYSNTNGDSNTASGDSALYSNTSGYHNTAFGEGSLLSNTTGSNNTALGSNAGYNLTHGSNNIDIGNEGVAGESGIIRIGTPSTQITTYIAGIESAKVTGAAVYVTSSGQLGVLASSERYKTAIAPMGAGTEKLQELRPVSFHLKSDPRGAVQYGLIAEEVAKIYPELVIRDQAGTIQGVRYDELAPMLLNEVQKQAAEIRELKQQQRQFATQAELNDLKQQLRAALDALRSKDELVARR
jgi:hypothetical protein